MRTELTAKGRATRNRIVEGAAVVLREKGVSAATLDDVPARTQTSKGQLFHYFPAGKDELLLAVAQHEADQVPGGPAALSRVPGSWGRVAAVAGRGGRSLREEQGDQCPLGSLFLHLGRSTPGARAIVIELMRLWQASLAAGIWALQAAGHLPAELDVEHRAAALLAGIQGGVSILQSTGRPDHLRAALDQGIVICAAPRPKADY